MHWPWQRVEKRESGGDFSDAVIRLIEAQAAGTAADASSTAAVEAASGALSRAFASASVQGPEWVKDAVTASVLAQIGRDLVRRGDSLHVIDVNGMGRVSLLPCSSWHFEGSGHPETWTVRATFYGPSTSVTRHLPYAGVIFHKWGSTPGQPYIGTGPLSWAHTTARLQSETERSLGNEMSGPIAQLLTIPTDGGDDSDDDSLKQLKADIRTAKGDARFVETTTTGWGEGVASAPRKDWTAERLGPNPPMSMATIRKDSFEAVLAAAGTPPSLFTDADGTSQREALRRWHMNLVQPLARLLEEELTRKFETDVSLTFDSYPLDLAGRAQAFQKMVVGGMDVKEALILTGLMGDE